MNPTERFGDRAEAYVVGRPSYPAAAIDAVLDGLGAPAEILAVDLGAGTGISARLLADRGVNVLALEPNAAMRDAAAEHPRVTWTATSAEATGLEEAAADLVVAFQAFHWFERPAVFDEIVRILRPGGRAAAVYNERDESDSFTRAYGEIVRRYATDDTEAQRERALAQFAAFEGWAQTRGFRYTHRHALDETGVLAHAHSASYLPRKGDVAQALDDEIRALVAAHDGRVEMAYVTLVERADIATG